MNNSKAKKKSKNLYIRLNLKVVAGVFALMVMMIGGLIIMGLELAQYNATETEDMLPPAAEKEKTTEEEKTTKETAEATAYFPLTDEQRTLIEQVVSAEARGEPFEGQVAVCQCIYNACIKDELTPEEVVKIYGYTTERVKPTESVKKAVAAVFDHGQGVTFERILYFYAPALTESEWHETQGFVLEIGGHRFFKETT